jgi:hypothetical protein
MVEDPPARGEATIVTCRFDWQSTSDVIADFAMGLQ